MIKSGEQVRLLAPAKINIGLRIIRKRSDKYHDIETVFYPIHLADELEITKSDKHEFFSNIHLEADANLCLRALHFFCERTGINAEVKITLKKNIPVGSGLGGGSSDAASVLLALQELYGKPLCEIELHDIATQLGADVPFFLKKTPSYATGKGEIIEPINLRITSFILTVTPNISVSTALAYSLVVPTGAKSKSLRDALLDLGNRYESYKGTIINDFETEVTKKFPVVGEIKSEMYEQGAQYALMSGSGSSVYGFFGNETLAMKACTVLSQEFSLRTTDVTPPQKVI
jgi:4-diphosphocytidyl-2-C-methyl-D-erythritol kinase